MADTDLQLKAIDALAQIHTSLKKVQRSPHVDPLTMNAIEMLYLHLADILKQHAPQDFEELEKKSLLIGKISHQQPEETIPISTLLDTLSGLGIKKISFDKDMESKELNVSLNLIVQISPKVQPEEDASKIPAESEDAQIQPENKIYVPLETDQEIVSDNDIEAKHISESIAEMEKVFIRLNALEGAIESVPSEEKREMMKRLSGRVSDWIEKQTIASPEYKEICKNLHTLLQDLISNGFFAEAKPIVDTFSKINTGILKKDKAIREAALEVLRTLASENNINLLFKEIHISEKNKTTEAFQILAGLGDVVIFKLLNNLREATESKERIAILHVIEEMGPQALPTIRASINLNAPWYFLRNMAYIIGRIGNETSADILPSLLLHKDKRVRKEALKSLGQTGGNKRGSILLTVLPQAEPELRVNIIEMLGKIRYADAVALLREMLKNKSLGAKDDLVSLQEKICNTLGAIGSQEAVKTLTEIAEAKSILGIGAYPKEVKYAAERALAYIKKRKQVEGQS